MTASLVAETAPGLRNGAGARMRAHAHLVTELRRTASGSVRSCVSTLHSEAPLILRPTRAKAPEPWAWDVDDVVRVALTAGAAGPVGGDDLNLLVEVGAGSSLVLSEISPTVLLPGPHGERSHTKVQIRVATGGTLIWLPEPMITARGCHHLNDVTVDLAEGARFFMREEILLGRHQETSGLLTQRVGVRLGGRPVYRQDLQIGTEVASTPAVLGNHRAVGSVVIVDPAWVDHPPAVHALDRQAAVLPLSGPAVLVSALGSDNLRLRSLLTAGLTALGPPWALPAPATSTPTSPPISKEQSHE